LFYRFRLVVSHSFTFCSHYITSLIEYYIISYCLLNISAILLHANPFPFGFDSLFFLLYFFFFFIINFFFLYFFSVFVITFLIIVSFISSTFCPKEVASFFIPLLSFNIK